MSDFSIFGISGHWSVNGSFGHYLIPPMGARIAIISYADNIGGLKPVCRCLPHQVYVKKILRLIEEKGSDLRLISVDYVGDVDEEDQTIMVYDKSKVKKCVIHSIGDMLSSL